MVKKILKSGDPVLRKKSAKVERVDKKILGLISDMEDTLNSQKEPEGVGLAAPQIGKNLQIFLANYKNFHRIVINPKILEIGKPKIKSKTDDQKHEVLEGCLSLPHYYGPLKRADYVKVQYLDQNGKVITEKFTGFNAQIVLHEIDHLNGKLFIDRLLEQGKPLYKVEGEKWEEVELI